MKIDRKPHDMNGPLGFQKKFLGFVGPEVSVWELKGLRPLTFKA